MKAICNNCSHDWELDTSKPGPIDCPYCGYHHGIGLWGANEIKVENCKFENSMTLPKGDEKP